MSKIKIKLIGRFSQRSVSIADRPVDLSGLDAEQSTVVELSRGRHELRWAVRGAHGAKYTLSLGGDTEAWEKKLSMPHGEDAGFKEFTVK